MRSARDFFTGFSTDAVDGGGGGVYRRFRNDAGAESVSYWERSSKHCAANLVALQIVLHKPVLSGHGLARGRSNLKEMSSICVCAWRWVSITYALQSAGRLRVQPLHIRDMDGCLVLCTRTQTEGQACRQSGREACRIHWRRL